MAPSSVGSLSFFCLIVLLLPAQHGASYESYKIGSRQVYFRTPGKSSGNSQQASTVPPTTNCKLPVSLTTADVLRRDALLNRRGFLTICAGCTGTTIPVNDYSVLVNFTGLNELIIPLVQFQFSNGESLLIDGDQQMFYYGYPAARPFTMACFAFSSLESGNLLASVIGSYTLASMEVIYDVVGGMVGFIAHSCYYNNIL